MSWGFSSRVGYLGGSGLGLLLLVSVGGGQGICWISVCDEGKRGLLIGAVAKANAVVKSKLLSWRGVEKGRV
jgi:uncharacterized membrane protein